MPKTRICGNDSAEHVQLPPRPSPPPTVATPEHFFFSYEVGIRMPEITHKMPKSASQVVVSRMKLILCATLRTPQGASRLVHAISAWSVKPDVLRLGIVGMRGYMVIQPRLCMR